MRHHLRFRALSRKAESLVESIVSITVIVIATTAALSLLRVAILGNEVVEEKLTAVNLAMEAIEALRNQRDTNYLRFPGEEDDCWDAFDVDTSDQCLEAAHKLSGAETYWIEREFFISDPITGLTNEDVPFLSWTVKQATPPYDDPSVNAETFVSLYSRSIEGLDGPRDILMYLQSGIVDSNFTLIKENAFQRLVNIDTIDEYSYDVTVTVKWWVDGVEKNIQLTRTIGNIL